MYTRLKRTKMSPNDFEPLTIIGKGAFGEVRLVKEKANRENLRYEKAEENRDGTKRPN